MIRLFILCLCVSVCVPARCLTTGLCLSVCLSVCLSFLVVNTDSLIWRWLRVASQALDSAQVCVKSKETYLCGKRDLFRWQKRPIEMAACGVPGSRQRIGTPEYE